MRRWSILLAAPLLGAFAATQAFAFQHHWWAMHAPWRIVGWWARYGWPHVRGPVLLGGAIMGICLCGLARHPRKRPQGARWATRRDVRRAGLFAPAGIVLGRYRGRPVRYAGDLHVLCVGPSGSGKSASHVIPTLLDWPESVVVHDPSVELYDKTARYRATFSRVIHLHVGSRTTDSYNPLEAVRLGTETEIRDTHLLADLLGDPDGQREKGGSAEHFGELADELRTGLVLHGLTTGRAPTLAAMDAMLTGAQPFPELVEEMLLNPHPAVQRAAHVVAHMDERQLAGVLSTARRATRIFIDPRIGEDLTGQSSFRLEELREQTMPLTVYLTIPFADQRRVRPLTRLILRQLIDYSITRETGWAQRLLLIVDELAALRYFPILEEGLDYLRKYGVQVMATTQSLNSLQKYYGPYHNFVEGSALRLIFPPNSGGMAQVFSRETGEETVEKTRTNRQQGAPFGRTTVTTEDTLEPLLSATALQHLGDNDVLLLVGNHPPARLTRAYYKQQPWKRRSLV
jgi:type IV secretion system protein VirD4